MVSFRLNFQLKAVPQILLLSFLNTLAHMLQVASNFITQWFHLDFKIAVLQNTCRLSRFQVHGQIGGFRNSCLEALYKNDFIKNFVEFTGKHVSVSLIKLQAEASNFNKIETLAGVLSSEFCEVFNNTFSIEHLRWLFLLF